MRIAYAAFNEKLLALWIGREQGFFRKNGVNVDLISIRTSGQAVAALVSGDIQMVFTIPGSVLNAFVGGVDAAFLPYTWSAVLKKKGFPVLLDIGKAPIPYQGLALAARRSYMRQNPQVVDSVLRAVLESVVFIQNPTNREAALRSLAKNLRLTSTKEAESGYDVLQWLYSLDIRPNLKGIQNMQRLLAVTNPKVAAVKAEDVVYETPVEVVQKSAFYEELVNRAKR